MFAGANTDVMTPLGIFFENAHTNSAKPYNNKNPVVIWIKCL